MASDKPKLATALTRALIERLATPANLRYGTAIHERDAVELIERNSYRATAWVGGLTGSVAEGGGQRRRVRISSTKAGITWHCAGNPKNHDIFCKHCVALALTVRDGD